MGGGGRIVGANRATVTGLDEGECQVLSVTACEKRKKKQRKKQS